MFSQLHIFSIYDSGLLEPFQVFEKLERPRVLKIKLSNGCECQEYTSKELLKILSIREQI